MPQIEPRLSAALADRYALERELGQGGMATVYLARDLKHNRQVAVKVLRPELAAILGGDRFLKEIEVTANLQHPNILPLYDSGEADTYLYYVMPYLEGESLRDKLDREKQFGIEETVELARAVAAALQFAHERGVVHRDIKPENILLQAGQALVADFGIALAVSQAGGTRLTETGLSLGTPHYMSPEQATGDRVLDARSDVYSLGAMVYEMLAGEPPHLGNSVQAIVSKILTEPPSPISKSRDRVPTNIDAALQRALSKSPADRFATAADFAAALVDQHFTLPGTAATRSAETPASPWNRISVTATSVAAVLLVVLLWVLFRPAAPAPVFRFAMAMDSTEGFFFSGFADPPRIDLLPDGSGIVYAGEGGDIRFQLWLRRFDQLHAEPLPGTELGWAPAVSPGGDRVAFVTADGRLLKVASLAGGPAVTLSASAVNDFPGWGPDGESIYFFQDSSLMRIPATGGNPVTVAHYSASGMEFGLPRILPDGRSALASARSSSLVNRPLLGNVGEAEAEVRLLDFETGESHVLVAGVYGLFDGNDHLIYVTADGTLMAANWRPGETRIRGQPVAVTDGVDVRAPWTDLALSAAGHLVYTNPGFNTPERVVWVGQRGQVEVLDPEWVRDVEFEGIAISPNESRLAVEIWTDDRYDIWVKQLGDRGPLSRLTFEGLDNRNPSWTADGRFISYTKYVDDQPGAIWRRRANGTGAEELVARGDRDLTGASWSADGDWLLLTAEGSPGSADILSMRVGVDSVPRPLLAQQFDEFEPALSPDGRWLAYVSDESGRREVYVRPFPDVDEGRWQISTDGGMEPLWSRDGNSLYYRTTQGPQEIHTADMRRGPDNAPRSRLLQLPPGNDYESNQRNRLFEVTSTGDFMMIEREGTPDVAGSVIMVLNFAELVRALMK